MTSLFNRNSAPAPVAPIAAPPPTMPDPFSPDVLDARRRAVETAGNGGRSSTNLTGAAGTMARAAGTIAGGAKLGG